MTLPLSLFDHRHFTCVRSVNTPPFHFNHTYGGRPDSHGLRFVNLDRPFHLIYRLDLADPTIPVRIPGVSHLPLVYGFRYAAYEGTFVYRMLNEMEVEILAPTELAFDPDFPYRGHPAVFPSAQIGFSQICFDPSSAEDALLFQGIFGLDKLSESELTRAIRIAMADGSYDCYSRNQIPGRTLTDEEIVRSHGCAPFMQTAPSKSCSNPECTAEIAYHVDAFEYELDQATAKLLGRETQKLEGFDIRVDTMRVIGLHEPDPDDELMWGDPYVQMIFEFCDCCHCIRVSNQCT
jgi:hypothetical protein